jgi:hypothetical protein
LESPGRKRNVTISHGLAETLAQLADEPKEFPGGGAPTGGSATASWTVGGWW